MLRRPESATSSNSMRVNGPADGGLLRIVGGSASGARRFEACSTFTHIPARMLAKSPWRTLYVEGFDELVVSSADPAATGWYD